MSGEALKAELKPASDGKTLHAQIGVLTAAELARRSRVGMLWRRLQLD